MIKLLPRWRLTDLRPAFYDCESGSAIEQTARVYAKMNELIEAYNAFADEYNKLFEEFKTQVTNDNEVFRVALRQEFQDFIDTIDLKILEMEADYNEYKTELSKGYEEFKTYLLSLLSAFENDTEAKIDEFTEELNKAFEEFRTSITNEYNTFVTNVNERIEEQNTVINNAVEYMKTNIEQTAINIINQKIIDNEFTVTVSYDATDEALYLSAENNNSVAGVAEYVAVGDLDGTISGNAELVE